MKKLLTLLFSITLLLFTGCTTKTTDIKPLPIVDPNAEIPTFFRGSYISVEESKAKLKMAGFEVLDTFDAVDDGKTIVFTSAELKAEAKKPNRAYAAVMKLFVDHREKLIVVTNPVYYGKAYMQDEYNHNIFLGVQAKIKSAFPNLKPSEDRLDFDDLGDFRFMIDKPRYEDTVVLAKGYNVELLEKARAYKDGRALAYELKLSEETTLLGFALKNKTTVIIETLGRENAALMPYPVVISNGEASMLKAQYYVPLNYPLLSMIEFGQFESAPNEIIQELKRVYK